MSINKIKFSRKKIKHDSFLGLQKLTKNILDLCIVNLKMIYICRLKQLITSFKMKKSFLTFAAIALVFSFTSCKETTTETTEESAVEVVETSGNPVELESVGVEEVVDTTSTGGNVAEDITDTTSVE